MPGVLLPPQTALRAEVVDDVERGGVSTDVGPGAWSGIRAWSGCDAYLRGLRLALTTHPDLLRPSAKDTVALDTFLRVVEVMARAADASTGREVRLSKARIAAAAGVSTCVVQRVRRIASRMLRCLVWVVRGRLLTLEERLRIWSQTRSKQRGVPPVAAFTVPSWLEPYMRLAQRRTLPVATGTGRRGGAPVDNSQGADLRGHTSAPQSRRGAVLGSTSLVESLPSEQDAGSKLPRGPGSARAAQTKRPRPRRTPPGARLAAQIRSQVWWAHGLRPWAVAGHLAPFEAAGWTAQTFLAVAGRVLADHGEHGWSSPDRVRSPGGYVHWLTQRMAPDEPADCDPLDVHPGGAGVVDDVPACGRPDCYRGWLDDGRDDAARPCPTCPPVVRSPAWTDPHDDLDAGQFGGPLAVELDEHGNPPF